MIKQHITLALTALALLGSAVPAVAESPKWTLAPGEANIEPLVHGGAYVTEKNGRRGLVDAQAGVLLPVSVDSITPVINGYALALKLEEVDTSRGGSLFDKVKNKTKDLVKHEKLEMYKLMGIYKVETNSYTPMIYGTNPPMYIGEYNFFSEGYLPVTHNGTKYGYITPDGNRVIKDAYTDAHPFSQGYALVNGKEYINPEGKKLKLAKNLGKVKEGYSFNSDGEALLETEDGYYTIDLRGNRLQKVVPEVDERIPENILGAWNPKDDPDPVKYASRQVPTAADKRISVFRNSSGRYGYRKNNQVIVPAQFTSAEAFNHGQAFVVTPEGRPALLSLSPDKLVMNVNATGKVKNGMQPYEVVVEVPEGVVRDDAVLTMAASNGKAYTAQAQPNDNGDLVFTLTAPRKAQPMSVTSGGLLIWDPTVGTDKYDMTPNEAAADATDAVNNTGALRIAISCSGRANIKGNVPVSVTVTNPTEETISAKVKISGNSLGASKSIKLGPGQSTTIRAAFTKVATSERRTVNVTAGRARSSRTFSLTPYVTL